MGWFGYGIYDGDETQSWHYSFLEWAKVYTKKELDGIEFSLNISKIPDDRIPTFKKNIPLILKKMYKVRKYWTGDTAALQWQMLLALFLDNKIKPPTKVKKLGVSATEYLMGEHAGDFCNTVARRRNLRNFIKRAQKY